MEINKPRSKHMEVNKPKYKSLIFTYLFEKEGKTNVRSRF